MHRLEFLPDPVYFIYRTMSLYGLLLAFGLVILLSNRISIDQKNGVKTLIMAGLTTKKQYLLGKVLGGLCYTATLFSLFLVVNALIYYCAAPFQVSIGSLVIALVKTIMICVLPVSLFISFLSVSLPALIDIRLFFAVTAVFFIINSSITGSAESMPYYCLTSGDLVKLIWQHPGWSFQNTGSIQANLLFLIGGGLLSPILLFAKKRFWRHD